MRRFARRELDAGGVEGGGALVSRGEVLKIGVWWRGVQECGGQGAWR